MKDNPDLPFQFEETKQKSSEVIVPSKTKRVSIGKQNNTKQD